MSPKTNPGLQIRTLETHEVDIVSGGMPIAMTTTVQQLDAFGHRPDGTFGGNSLFGIVYKDVIFPRNIGMPALMHGAAHVQLPAGL